MCSPFGRLRSPQLQSSRWPVQWMLVRVSPELLFRTTHHQQVRYDLIRRTHHAGPAIPIIADRVQAKRAQQDSYVIELAKCYGRTPLAEQIRHLTALANLREMTCEQIQLKQILRNQAGKFLLRSLLGLEWPGSGSIQCWSGVPVPIPGFPQSNRIEVFSIETQNFSNCQNRSSSGLPTFRPVLRLSNALKPRFCNAGRALKGAASDRLTRPGQPACMQFPHNLHQVGMLVRLDPVIVCTKAFCSTDV